MYVSRGTSIFGESSDFVENASAATATKYMFMECFNALQKS